jgi:hypothetical protein
MLKEVGRWFRYLYYMRFSILLWVFPLLLVAANSPSAARSLVSGIVTPTSWPQYLCVAFFLVAASFVALILARIVVINGEERFGDAPPKAFVWLLADEHMRHEWVAPAASQINNMIVFWYFFVNGRGEDVDAGQIGWGIAAGVVMAFLFWLAVNAVYYLNYQPAPEAGGKTARTLMFPRGMLRMSSGRATARFGDVLEDATPTLSLKWLAQFFPVQGYRWPPDGDFYEGQYFSIMSACGFFALYWMLWPLTAPVQVPVASNVALVCCLLGGLAVIALVISAKPAKQIELARLRVWKVIISAAVLLFVVPIPFLYFHTDAERFPILALVLILVISVGWALGGIAFFADRFRVPVLTTVIVLMVIPRALHWDNGQEAHYLSTSLRPVQATLPTPADILNYKLDQNEDLPVIVVTSTGGGIHAAAWTTAVLTELETDFSKDSSLRNFHDHVILLSTVSGGSAGLYPYLRELDPNTNNGANDWKRMKLAARCSSLEAVGWGLIYFDLPKAFVPLLPYVEAPSSGVDDLSHAPLGKDRTWALRKAFARNLNDPYCQGDLRTGEFTSSEDLRQAEQGTSSNQNELALGNLNPLGGIFPAFTMNTTTVEGGERFLSANYQVPPHPPNPLDPQPAESFLQAYGGQQFTVDGKTGFTDLPLATGAQMSATFPYVSSAAGFPFVNDMKSVHFVDGGYYDNDGTGSAIEFLQHALDGVSPTHSKATIKVLLIEIRNSGASVRVSESSDAWQPNPNNAVKPWNLVDQVMAPPNAFYSGGHESVTSRNRDSLILLDGVYKNRPVNPLVLEHIVITDEHDSVPDKCAATDFRTDPLNWSLTPAQQCEVDQSATQPSNVQIYQQAKDWFIANSGHTEAAQKK